MDSLTLLATNDVHDLAHLRLGGFRVRVNLVDDLGLLINKVLAIASTATATSAYFSKLLPIELLSSSESSNKNANTQ